MMWTPLIFNIDDITDTLRSWVHEYLIPFMTFSLRLVNNDTLKWYSDNFPYITYTSPCIHGENYVMYGKLWEHHFNVPQSQGEGPTTDKNFMDPGSQSLTSTFVSKEWPSYCYLHPLHPLHFLRKGRRKKEGKNTLI